MMFLEPKRGYAPIQKRRLPEAWRDSAYHEGEPEVSGSLRPIAVGILLLVVFYGLRTYAPSQTPREGGDSSYAAQAASNGSQALASETDLSAFGLTTEQEGRADYAAWQLNASVRWRQTHSVVHTCSVFADRRVTPTLVRFLVLVPTVQLVPSYGFNGSRKGNSECLFLRRNSTPARGTFLAESRGRHQDEAHVPVYRNGSARVEACASEHPAYNCSSVWNSEVVVSVGKSVPVGGMTSAPYEPAVVTCSVPEDASPRLVSLVYGREESAYWFVPRKLHYAVMKHRGTVGVCVPPWISEDIVGTQRDLVEYFAYYAALGARHFNVYVNATDRRTLAFLLGLKKQSPVSITYRSWPGVPAENDLAFAEAALVMDCAFSFSNTPIEYVTTLALREFIVLRKASTFRNFLSKPDFANATSLMLLSQAFAAEGGLNVSGMLLAQRDKLRVLSLLDPPGRTSRVFLKTTRIVDADAAQAYHTLQPNPITVDSEEGVVLRYVTSLEDCNSNDTDVTCTDFSEYAKEFSSLTKWGTHIARPSPLVQLPWNTTKKTLTTGGATPRKLSQRL